MKASKVTFRLLCSTGREIAGQRRMWRIKGKAMVEVGTSGMSTQKKRGQKKDRKSQSFNQSKNANLASTI